MYKNLLNNFFIVIGLHKMMLIICFIMLLTLWPLVAKLTYFVLNFWVIKSRYLTIGFKTHTRVINTDGIEVYILAICLFLSYIAIIIQLDFIKDFGKTYFLKQYKNNQPDVH